MLNNLYKLVSDSYNECYEVREFYIKLKPSANDSMNIDENMQEWSKLPFQRTIKYDDLCDITITYKDNKVVKYNLDWCDLDGNWQENAYQKSLIDVDGSLHITVHKRNKEGI